jgi:hypothetical protein
VGAANLLQEYEARIAALERLVGKQALELEFLKVLCETHRRRFVATTDSNHDGPILPGSRALQQSAASPPWIPLRNSSGQR